MVVHVLGVLSGPEAVAGNGLAIDLAEPPGLVDAATVVDMFQDRGVGFGVESAVKERGAFAFREASFAGAAPQEAGLLGTVVAGDVEVSGPPLLVMGAVGIEAEEASEVVVVGTHGVQPKVQS